MDMPEPLVLKDFKKLDGKPVWVVPSNFAESITKQHHAPEWGLVNWKEQKLYTKEGRWYQFCWNSADPIKQGRWTAYFLGTIEQ